MLALLPERVHLVRYEEMRHDTVNELREVAHFLGLPEASPDELSCVVEQSSKEAMAQKETPGRKYKVVRQDDSTSPLALYSEGDKRFFLEGYRQYCKADFGYDLDAGW